MTAGRRYRTAAMSLVDRQFAFAGPKVLGKFLDGLLDAFPEIDLERNYPVSWLVYRVTGVVARDDDLEAQVVPGHDLLADAALLANRLASRRGPAAHDSRVEVPATEIAAAWGVSRRTLQRWRDDGLPMMLARFPDGVARSVCRRSIVESFARRHPARLARASSFLRSTPEERAGIASEFEATRSKIPTTTAAIDAVARRRGRSPAMVREAIRRGEIRRPSRDARTRRWIARLVARARARSVPVVEIAARIDRSPAVVRRLELAGRFDAVAVSPSPTVTPPNLERPDAAEVFGVAGLLDDSVATFAELGLFEWLSRIRDQDQADEESDRARIAAMNFALARARRGVDAITRDGGAVRERDLDLVESHLRWSGMLLERAMLAGLNAGLRRFEQSVGRRLDQLPAARAMAALDLLLDAVSSGIREFDPTRRASGHALHRSVGLAVSRRVARESGWSAISGARRRPTVVGGRRVDMMAAVPEPMRSLLAPVRWWRALDPGRRSAFDAAPELPTFLIRFGLDAPGRPRSLVETGKLVGRPATRWSGGMEALLRSVRRAAIDAGASAESG